ncbi:MAG: macro domain-containing protein [Candidatus Zixiibacteriota bacterium]
MADQVKVSSEATPAVDRTQGDASDTLKIKKTTLRLVKGDITVQAIESFVYYARPDLALGSGFGTAIAQRGGPAVQEELNGLGPLATGDVVITAAGDMKAEYIIHAVGPRFQEEDLEAKLKLTVQNCLVKAEEKGIRAIAFPPMGAGFYGVPLDLSARITLGVIGDYLMRQTGITDVVVCLFDNREYLPFQKQLAAIAAQRGR